MINHRNEIVYLIRSTRWRVRRYNDMNKFSVNDWLTLQTRKDLTYIRRNLEHKTINYAIFADLFIAFLSFVLDHALWPVSDAKTCTAEELAPSWYWICTALLLAVVPVIIFINSYIHKRQHLTDMKMVMPVEYLINLFDNEICYNVMTADSMRDHFLDSSVDLENVIKKFYFIETLYYVNKTIAHLYYFKNQGQNAIHTKNTLDGISYIRFKNACEIVYNIYTALLNYVSNNSGYKPLLEDSMDSIYNFNDLVNHMGNIPELKEMKTWVIHI